MGSQEWQGSSHFASGKVATTDPAGYLSNKTIVALATPLGGALGIIRLSGPDAFLITEKITGKNKSFFTKENFRKTHRAFFKGHSSKVIDDGMFIAFENPKSFTGEDLVEFFIHGSHIVGDLFLETALFYGARMALPGEFSFRAVRSNKISVEQAQGINEVIHSDNEISLEMALEKLSGHQSQITLQIKEQYMTLLTLAEAGIDFSDQDLDEVSLPVLKLKAKSIIENLNQLEKSFERGKKIAEGIPISILGLPNAGKSSFFNALLGEDRSIVSNIEGTTRDVVKERITLRGPNGRVLLKLADTAGLRVGTEEIEAQGIERSLKSARGADVLLIVIDSAQSSSQHKPPINEYWEKLATYLQPLASTTKNPQKKVFVIINKIDLIQDSHDLLMIQNKAKDFFDVLNGFTFLGCYEISSKTEKGIHEFSLALAKHASTLIERKSGELILTSEQSVTAVRKAKERLQAAIESIDIVIFATEVRYSMNELSLFLGLTVSDDILGKIFSDFCIGK